MDRWVFSRWGGVGQVVTEEREASVSRRHEVRILIVHPDRLFREVLALALSASTHAVIVMACVADAEELAHHEIRDPDVVLLGGQVGLREVYGQAVRLRTRFPAARVLVIGKPLMAMRS